MNKTKSAKIPKKDYGTFLVEVWRALPLAKTICLSLTSELDAIDEE